MNLKTLVNKQQDAIAKRDADLKQLKAMDGKVNSILHHRLSETIHDFYQPEIEKLQIQIEAIQAYMASEGG